MKTETVLLNFIFWEILCPTESIDFQARKMDADFQFGLSRGKVRAAKNPPRLGALVIG